MSVHPVPAPGLETEEKCLVAQLRSRLCEKMPKGIPSDLDTDLNLARWIRGYQKNIDKIVEVMHLLTWCDC